MLRLQENSPMPDLTALPGLAIVISHPTQFEAPLFKKITARGLLDLKLFFWTTDQASTLVDPELGHPPGWDFPLTEGYEYATIPSGWLESWTFIKKEIIGNARFGAVLVNGYGHRIARMTILEGMLDHKPIILRSDTTLLYPRSWYKEFLRRPMLTWMFSRIFAFMATGTHAAQNLSRYGVGENRIFYLPYSVDNERLESDCRAFRTKKESLRAEMRLNQSDVVLLGVLKFIPREGVFDLLRAYATLAARHPELALVLVGDGEQKEALLEYVKLCHLPKVIFTGYQPYSALPKYYALADVYVHPALREPWGVSLNEAMCCGLPVIASNFVGAAYDLILEGANGFVYPAGEIEKLAEAIEKFLSLRDHHQAMSKKSEEIILGWGYEKCIHQLKEVLSFVASER